MPALDSPCRLVIVRQLTTYCVFIEIIFTSLRSHWFGHLSYDILTQRVNVFVLLMYLLPFYK